MSLDKESLIEAYIRNIDSLTPKQRARAKQMIVDDVEAGELAYFFSNLYVELNVQPAGSADIGKITNALFFSPRVVRLRPRNPNRIDARSGLPQPVSLSASTVARASGYSYVGSVIADDDYVIIRFLMDEKTDRVRGFVLSEDAKYMNRTLLSVSDSGPHFLSTPNGRFDFSLDSSDVVQLLHQHMYLRRAIGDLKLDLLSALTTEFQSFEIDIDTILSIRLRDSTIELRSVADSRPLFVTTSPSVHGQQMIHSVGPETTSIELPDATHSVRLYFFG